MEIPQGNIIPILIEEEMKDSYIDYSMSVIVSRALPDVRDGLKPVHRRILYAMNELGLTHNRSYKKSARIVGEVLGKYHPHGDAAVYDTMVRMVQDFSLRYPLIDGQGNFGSVDGDSAAAMRYTEAKMQKLAEEMLKDIDKNTVNFVPNFDETLTEPEVLPAGIPNLLVNGSSGIAVGMATNIPPHNMSEVIDGAISLIDNPEISINELMNHIPAPDFPTGAIIYGVQGVKEAYHTGRGKITIRAKVNVETKDRTNKENIVISEIPYQVNKANLIEKIAELVKNKKLEGISDIRDESDRDGLRVVIELKKGAHSEVITNQLYKHTQLQVTFGVILLALVNGIPKVLNLKEMLRYYIDHRHEILIKRTKFELEAAEKKAHIALDNIDEIIALIKRSKDPENAKQGLIKKFKLSEVQAKAILDMRLQKLTGLERDKVEQEYRETIMLIEKLNNILNNRNLQMEIIKEELLEIKKKYGDERKTEIIKDYTEFEIEDMIAEEEMVITISHQGYIKRFPISGYKKQMRGGKGSLGTMTKEEDFPEYLFIASTHHYILFFTTEGRCHWIKVYDLPQVGKASRGRAIVNLLKLSKDEKVAAFVASKEFPENEYVIMATRKGLIKKTPLSAYGNPRKGGINAINISDGDALISAAITDGDSDIILGTRNGFAIRFQESEARPLGRTATGVIGIRLSPDDAVVGMVVSKREGQLMVVSENGYGKRSDMSDYRITHRAGKGITTLKTTDKVGKMVAIFEVTNEDDLMLITERGLVIRIPVEPIRKIGRNTQGVKLIKLAEEDKITCVAKVVKNENMNNNKEE